MKKLRALIRMTSVEAVASNVFVIEIHGYHSRKFRAGLRVASQAYTRELVLRAVKRDAIVVLMRGVRHWMELVPELRGVASLSVVRNVQNPTISSGNCERFEEILRAVGR